MLAQKPGKAHGMPSQPKASSSRAVLLKFSYILGPQRPGGNEIFIVAYMEQLAYL